MVSSFLTCCSVFARETGGHAPLQSEASADNSPNMVPALPLEMLRSKSESRILQPASSSGRDCDTPISSSARSLYEASALRVALHAKTPSAELKPDEEDGGVPRKFIEAYLGAIKASNARWASDPAVSNLFAENTKLFTQDKQTIVGKVAVIRRLEKGMETLIKMAGKDAAAPSFDLSGPEYGKEKSAHIMSCTIRRGSLRVSFALEFTLVHGKIILLRHIRL